MKLIHILRPFYHQLLSLVLSTDLLIQTSRYAEVGLNYTELQLLQQMFLKNG